MGKIYDNKGVAMNTQQIFGEISNTITSEQASVLATALKNQPKQDNDHRKLAHAILDCYAVIEDERMRRLFDKVMTKFQKSTTPLPKDDQSACHSMMCDIIRKSGITDGI